MEEAKVKDTAIRKKDEEMEAKDKEIARLRREAYGIEQIDVDTGRVEVVEHLGQESPAKCLRRQADAGARVSVELHGKLVEVKKEKTEAVGQMCQQRAQVSEAIECPLCMEREASTSLSCGHCFCCHADCDDFSAPGAACPMCRVPVTTTIKLFGGIHTLSDMLALTSHGVEQEMMSMDTCENVGSKAPADQPEVRTILSSGPTSEKRPRVQPDRSFPPGEAPDKAQTKSKQAAKHGAAGKSSASLGRKRGRQSRDSDINSDEECNKEEQRQLKLALEASKREASGGSRARRCKRHSDDHDDDESDEFKRAVKASLSNDVVVSDHVNLVEGIP